MFVSDLVSISFSELRDIKKCVTRWKKCVGLNGDYVEK